MIIQISDTTLRLYLRGLSNVGYIERTTPNTTRRIDSEYRVISKLGVLTPVIIERQYLYDPNTKMQYSFKTGDLVLENEEKGNECLRYSLLLGKEYNFLATYKNRYKHEHPELKSAKEWYDHVKNFMLREDALLKKLKFIKTFLAKGRKAKDFSRLLKEKSVFKGTYSFAEGNIRIDSQENRILMAEDTLKRYENAVLIFEELYGSIVISKEKL